MVAATLVATCWSLSFGSDARESRHAPEKSPLVLLAEQQFPGLTRGERALLEYADIKNIGRGDIAVCGTSSNPDDPTNDPKDADKWVHQREIRASLIRWLCVDPDAVKLVDPKGIRVLGARITDSLDLSHVSVRFPLVLRRCRFARRINVISIQVPGLDLAGSWTGEVAGSGAKIMGDLALDNGFHSSGEVYFDAGAAVDGEVLLEGAHLQHSAIEPENYGAEMKRALNLGNIRVGGDIIMCCGFEVNGAVELSDSTVGASANFGDGSISNPGKVAIDASDMRVAGTFSLSDWEGKGRFQSVGLVELTGAAMNLLYTNHAQFAGTVSEPHGLIVNGASVKTAIIFLNTEFADGATLDLSGTSCLTLVEDEKSWPASGRLIIEGLSYGNFSAGPADSVNSLRWLALQSGFHSQPYRQLANILRKNGDERGAIEVLIAEEDARYERLGPLGRLWGGLLRVTIGYGHRPLLAIAWSLAVVFIGWAVVLIGKRAGVMRLTWPETTPPPERDLTAGLHPFSYSLDVFLPFVNLHQEHYWWPDEAASGECSILGHKFSIRGSVIRYYLWLQIFAGWLLSAIFVAGVTGLIRND